MIIQNPRIKAKCPQCGCENVRSKWSLTTIVACVGKILGAQTVKIWEKRCSECGKEFQVFRKYIADSTISRNVITHMPQSLCVQL
jgi:predicted nucleic-acid-binding Zn-ribbon protein